MASLSLSDISGTMRVPVTVGSSSETLEKVSDPFEDDKVELKMDHEVERVLREWDTNKQRITLNSFRIRPTTLSSSTPTSPFQQRRKRVSTSLSNLSTKEGAPRKYFEFPEVNITRRQDSRLDSSADYDVVNEDAHSPLYVHCPNSGQKLFKMEFDMEGYPHENITIRVAGNKLVIHALQNESVEGRMSTTEFCRKVKLPPSVNSRQLECHVNPDNGMLVVTAPVLRHASSSSPSSLSPHSPSQHRNEPLNVPYVRANAVGKTVFINAEVGRVFKSDDVTVKVIGQDKLLITAQREESTDGNKLSASLSREFVLPDKIIPKTIQAGLTTDGVLQLSAMLESEISLLTSNGKVHIEHLSPENTERGTSRVNGVAKHEGALK